MRLGRFYTLSALRTVRNAKDEAMLLSAQLRPLHTHPVSRGRHGQAGQQLQRSYSLKKDVIWMRIWIIKIHKQSQYLHSTFHTDTQCASHKQFIGQNNKTHVIFLRFLFALRFKAFQYDNMTNYTLKNGHGNESMSSTAAIFSCKDLYHHMSNSH